MLVKRLRVLGVRWYERHYLETLNPYENQSLK